MKGLVNPKAYTDSTMGSLQFGRVVPKMLQAAANPLQEQGRNRKRQTYRLHAVRSDKQSDQADSNTLQLIADITQYVVPKL